MSSLVLCPQGFKCKNKCDEKNLFNIGDQSSNKCKFVYPTELARKAQETYKLDKVDWLCGEGHITKGVAEGKATPCEQCDQTLRHRLEKFLMIRLR